MPIDQKTGDIELKIRVYQALVYVWAVVVAQVVAHRTTKREVLGSIPTGSWAFCLFPVSQSVLRPSSGPSWRCNTTCFQLSKKMISLPVQPEAKQA